MFYVIFGRSRSKPHSPLCFISTLFLSVILSCPDNVATGNPNIPKLLLITLDGFGWNFLTKLPSHELPNFQAFMKKGVHVRWVENVFPTMTRPNHMSLVSGLYTESHGIVDNVFYDPTLQAAMPGEGKLKEEDSEWVDVGAEPVWVTNSKSGYGRRSGTIYWPCADAKFKGRMPDEMVKGEWTKSEEQDPPADRINRALDWLMDNSSNPVNFAAVYMNEPDDISHKCGPDSQQVLDSIRSRDGIMKHLLSEIKARNLEGKLNVIITSDHGQQAIYRETAINIDMLVDPGLYDAYPPLTHSKAAVSNLWPKGNYTALVNGLKGKHRNLHVSASANSQDLFDLHYATNRRIAPVVVHTEPGWYIVTNQTNFVSNCSGSNGARGQHGWDPRKSPFMWPFFMALGPAFKTNVRDADPFHIVDIYPLMCHILGINPAPNNGSLSNAAHILQSHPAEKSATHSSVNYTWLGVGLLVIILVVVVVMIVMRYIRSTKNVTASYKRTFARAGSTDDMMDDGMVVISDEEL